MSAVLLHGGPAFPTVTINDSDLNLTDPFGTLLPPGAQAAYAGMTLRDYFAIRADVGGVEELSASVGAMLLGRAMPSWQADAVACLQWWADYRALLRYMEADGMLKARSIPPQAADSIHPMDECRLHPGNRRVDCEHCKASQ